MTVEVQFWELVSLMVTLCSGAIGAFVVLGRMFLAQAQKHIDERFASQDAARNANHEQLTHWLNTIDAQRRDEAAQWQRVERELLTLKSELPMHYVRREDYVPTVATIMAKFDSLWLKIENLMLKGETK